MTTSPMRLGSGKTLLSDSSQPAGRSSQGLRSGLFRPAALPANRPTRVRLRSMLTLLVTLAIPAGAIADSITGQAIAVLDGDTFEIRDSANTIQRVRLSLIDAPEKHQDFSSDSKISLTELIQGKAVRVDIAGTGQHGGWIGKVWVDGLDANLEQIKRGMAWILAKPSPDPRYFDAEKDARMARRGIWSKDGAVPPWEYRNLEIRWRE